MPTYDGETLHDRYAREHADHLAQRPGDAVGQQGSDTLERQILRVVVDDGDAQRRQGIVCGAVGV